MTSRIVELKAASPRDRAHVLADWQTVRIREAMGQRFLQNTRVVLIRPRWMPGWLYRRLLRSIVVEGSARVDRGRPR